MEAELGLTGLALTGLKYAQQVKRTYEDMLAAGATEAELGTQWQRDVAQTYATLALVKAVRDLTEKLGD